VGEGGVKAIPMTASSVNNRFIKVLYGNGEVDGVGGGKSNSKDCSRSQ